MGCGNEKEKRKGTFRKGKAFQTPKKNGQTVRMTATSFPD